MISQYKIANFYWFIYLIQNFTENALSLYILLNQFDNKSTLLLVKLKIFPVKLLEFNLLLLKFEIMKKFKTRLR